MKHRLDTCTRHHFHTIFKINIHTFSVSGLLVNGVRMLHCCCCNICLLNKFDNHFGTSENLHFFSNFANFMKNELL